MILRYWKPLAALVLLAAVYYWGWSNGHAKAELGCLKDQAERDVYKDYSADLNRQLKEALAHKSAPKIKEVIRANPSGCSVPKPVADGMREAIRSANAAQ